MPALTIPEQLAVKCRNVPEREEWLARLPATVRELQVRWSITVREALDTKEASCSWVAPAVLADGTSVVLKFLGDAAYDATQHLFNCVERLCSNPRSTMDRFADLLGLDQERVRLWTFARAAAEPRDDWKHSVSFSLAREIAP